MIQSQDPQDSAEFEAWIRQRSHTERSISLTSTSRFLRSKEIDAPEMLQRKFPAQTVHREQWRCITCSLSTQLTARDKCRAQAQHNGKILSVPVVTQHMFSRRRLKSCKFSPYKVVESLRSCRARQVPKIQKVRKTSKFTDIIVDVPVVLMRQCQPSGQVLDRIPTTGAKDTDAREIRTSQASQTPSAMTRLTMSSREWQPIKRCQTSVKHE